MTNERQVRVKMTGERAHCMGDSREQSGEEWGVKLENLHVNSSFTPFSLCDFGHVIDFCVPQLHL